MHSQKRVFTFALVMMASVLTIDFVLRATGLVQPPPPQPRAALPKAAVDKGAEVKAPVVGQAGKPIPPDVKAAEPPKVKEAAVALFNPDDLVLGSSRRQGPDGYRMELQLDQKGAGVASALSSQYEAEYERGRKKGLPLPLLKRDPLAPASLALTLRDAKAVDPMALTPGAGEVPLDSVVWEVVKDDKGRIVRPVSRPAAGKAKALVGQELVFRVKVDDLGAVVSKTFRLFQGQDGFEVDLAFEATGQPRSLVYRLLGPHGVPIEGEWYTSTFRDAVFAPAGTSGKPTTLSAYEVVGKSKSNPERFQKYPLKYAGVENQYFAAIIEPDPVPTNPEERWDYETYPVVLHEDPKDSQKADIGVDVVSRPILVGPGTPVRHAYKVFVGPKTAEALTPYGAKDLTSYRKSGWFFIPFAPYFATAVITPLLDSIYGLTGQVARLFGGKAGNYGVAIILLTMLVRLAMFPLSRKQAISAKRMQDLQPLLKEIQAKNADDKEAQTKETWALYKRHGVNPIGGCLPALIQLPIFVGLWQALNNSVRLRHASFLYIQNLAAPMMFAFPTELPLLGNYFNLLPFLVVSLMLVQTKLFSPPATTPEAEMQQKMMKYMMVFMAFMFYKVPSGLGIYFITSSLWQICERLLLPRVTASAVKAQPGPDDAGPSGGGGRGPSNAPDKPPGRFAQFWEKVLDEAAKNPTYRNLTEEKDRAGNPGRDPNRGNGRDPNRGGRGPDRGKPSSRPGRGGR